MAVITEVQATSRTGMDDPQAGDLTLLQAAASLDVPPIPCVSPPGSARAGASRRRGSATMCHREGWAQQSRPARTRRREPRLARPGLRWDQPARGRRQRSRRAVRFAVAWYARGASENIMLTRATAQ